MEDVRHPEGPLRAVATLHNSGNSRKARANVGPWKDKAVGFEPAFRRVHEQIR